MASSIALEVHRDSATLHLRGLLGAHEISRASVECSRLPDDVQVLCVSLHRVSLVDAGARKCITSLIREWRAARSGQVVLSVTTDDLESLTDRRLATATSA